MAGVKNQERIGIVELIPESIREDGTEISLITEQLRTYQTPLSRDVADGIYNQENGDRKIPVTSLVQPTTPKIKPSKEIYSAPANIFPNLGELPRAFCFTLVLIRQE